MPNGELITLGKSIGKFDTLKEYLHESKQYVKIEVNSGVAEVTECPKNITVEILDHDQI